MLEVLTSRSKPGGGQCLVGSLTGMVASERETEASKGSLKTVGNRFTEYKGKRELDCETDKSSRYESRA